MNTASKVPYGHRLKPWDVQQPGRHERKQETTVRSQGSRIGDDVQLGARAVGGAKRVDFVVPANANCKIGKIPNGRAPDAPRTGTACSGEHDGA